jgi:hypothetical protein
LPRWRRTIRHFEEKLYGIAARNAFVTFEKIDLVSGSTARVAFENKSAGSVFEYGKTRMLVIVKWTRRGAFCVIT